MKRLVFGPTSCNSINSFSKQNNFFKDSVSQPLDQRLSKSWSFKTLEEKRMFSTVATSSKGVSPAYREGFLNRSNSLPMIERSELTPIGMPVEKYLEGAVIGSLVGSIKSEVPVKDALILAALDVGHPGSNMTIIETVSNKGILGKRVDLVGFMPADLRCPRHLQEVLANLPAKKIMHFSEIYTMLAINRDLEIPLELYQKKTPLIDGSGIQNLTGNSCPDFIRNFKTPIGSIHVEAFDQKFSKSSFMPNTHIRPVSGDLGSHTKFAMHHLENQIDLWKAANVSESLPSGLQQALVTMKDNYLKTKDAEAFGRSLNQLNNQYLEFFLVNRIPRNMVAEVSIQNLAYTSPYTKTFRNQFLDMYYNENSPWPIFVNNYIKLHNIKDINYDRMIVSFMEYYAKAAN